MKEQITRPDAWHTIDIAAQANPEAPERVRVFAHVHNLRLNAPTNGVHISFAKENPSRIRVVLAQGMRGPATVEIPDGYANSAHYASERAIDVLSQGRNVPLAVKQLARELHPNGSKATHPHVSIGVANVVATPANGVEAQVHKAGAVKVFVRTVDGQWREVLAGALYTEAAIKRLEDLTQRYDHLKKVAAGKYGADSQQFKRLQMEFLTNQKDLLGRFKSWACPPLGMFSSSAKLQKVKNISEPDIDAVVMTTANAMVTVDDLNALESPHAIGRSFFADKHQSKREVAAVVVARQR
jgi:hypothetical protein